MVLVLVAAVPVATSSLAAEAPPEAAGVADAVGSFAGDIVPLASTLPGIDVSHWQGAIDWHAVAASGIRFAIAKATDGRTYVDETYLFNKAGAEANGIAFGAYHFARPDDSANDAIREADHFVENAQLHAGNLVPVLDLERTGGLSQADVTTWILTWLDRVTERLGVRPMVYTSPSGWDTRTGGTTAVAAAGYTVLWVAHWGVSSPRLPADDWNGNGWTFWQYSATGSVPGIDGDVDLDLYAGTDLSPVTIPSPDTTPPVATIGVPTSVDGTTTVTFSERVRGVTADNVYVWSTSSGTYPELDLTCRSGSGAVVDCVIGRVRSVTIVPVAPLVPGETYQAVVNPAVAPTLVADAGGNPAPSTTADFAPPTDLEEDSAAILARWSRVDDPDAYGGAALVERRAGATATFAFSGPKVTWYTSTGPAMGKAAVLVDGVEVATLDLYSRRPAHRVARTFDSLGPGPHTLEIRVLGRARAAASDTRVIVDAISSGGDLWKNPTPSTTWAARFPFGTSGDGVIQSDLAGASVEVTFRGTGIEWVTYRDVDQGRAEIYVDDVRVRRVDNHADVAAPDVVRTIDGLTDGVHTLRIVVLGTSRRAATGALVSVDRFSVLP